MTQAKRPQLRRRKSAEPTQSRGDLTVPREEQHAGQKWVTVPEVGALFMIGDEIYAKSTPITEAGTYGKFLIEETDHVTFWPELQQAGVAPKAMEYDECPRGRVTWDIEKCQARLFLDRCIIEKAGMVNKIINSFHLPLSTIAERDDHYRCPGCMRKSG